MERIPAPVKRQRTYDSTLRRQHAERSRDQILATARELLLRDGFTATTVARIAKDAGVSVDTIYKTYGGKPGLVQAIYERSLAGRGPVPAEQRSNALQKTEPDPRAIVRGFGRFMSEVSPLSAPIQLLIAEAAAVDPEMEDLRVQVDEERFARMSHNARNLARAGHLRPGLRPKDAAEVMWAYTAPELYQLLVMRRGWTPSRFGTFVADAMIAALLPVEA